MASAAFQSRRGEQVITPRILMLILLVALIIVFFVVLNHLQGSIQ